MAGVSTRAEGSRLPTYLPVSLGGGMPRTALLLASLCRRVSTGMQAESLTQWISPGWEGAQATAMDRNPNPAADS